MFIGHSFLTDCECFCRETKHVPFICMLTLQTGPKGSVCFFYKSMGAFYPSFIYRIYNRLLLNILYVINQKYGLNL